jgi:hypothetical protein
VGVGNFDVSKPKICIRFALALNLH